MRESNPECKNIASWNCPSTKYGDRIILINFRKYTLQYQVIKILIYSNSYSKNVAGEQSLNQEDGIHPNEKGAKIVAHNVIEALKPLL